MTNSQIWTVVIKPNSTSLATPVGRRERKRNETRDKLFHSALQLFAKNGFASTRVEEITEAADVAKGTFFNYFPSKDHVLLYFASRQIGRVELCLEQATAGEEPIRKLVRSMAEDLLVLPSSTPELARSMLASFMSSEEVRKVVREQIADRGRRILAQILEIGQSRNEIRTDMEAYELARTFQQCMFGTLLLWSLHPAEPITGILKRTFEVMWSGMRVPMPVKTQRKK
ncbi:MAG TPA: TetR/AcrR family transcriptional regulator [Terriglobales bacterium]|nr:TetR/AcrR family transcriptional regulator [Terriglobales bacterium]